MTEYKRDWGQGLYWVTVGGVQIEVILGYSGEVQIGVILGYSGGSTDWGNTGLQWGS